MSVEGGLSRPSDLRSPAPAGAVAATAIPKPHDDAASMMPMVARVAGIVVVVLFVVVLGVVPVIPFAG